MTASLTSIKNQESPSALLRARESCLKRIVDRKKTLYCSRHWTKPTTTLCLVCHIMRTTPQRCWAARCQYIKKWKPILYRLSWQTLSRVFSKMLLRTRAWIPTYNSISARNQVPRMKVNYLLYLCFLWTRSAQAFRSRLFKSNLLQMMILQDSILGPTIRSQSLSGRLTWPTPILIF